MAKGMKDALRLASKDAKFALDFVKNPEAFKDEYSLTDEQVAKIKSVSVSEMATHLSDSDAIAADGDYY